MTEQIVTVPIDRIRVDPAVQPRVAGLDAQHVASLADAIDDLPPPTVTQGEDNFTLVDGAHTLAVHQNAGRTELKVRIVDVPEDGDLRGLAFALNVTHGMAMTLADKREEARRQLRQNSSLSDREIGRRCVLSQPTVATIRSEMERSSQIEPSTSRTGKDGRTYPATQREAGPETEEVRIAKLMVRLCKVFYELSQSPHWTDAKRAKVLIEAHFEEDDIQEMADYLIDGARQVVATFRALDFQI